MLWLNLIMDSLASLALATEQPTDAMLDLPPYSSRQSLLTPTVCCLHTLCVCVCVCVRVCVRLCAPTLYGRSSLFVCCRKVLRMCFLVYCLLTWCSWFWLPLVTMVKL